MRVLWLTKRPGLLKRNQNRYNGGGWVDSLQRLIKSKSNICLGMTYLTNEIEDAFEEDGIMYFPIYTSKLSTFDKLKIYYGGYKKIEKNRYVNQINDIVEKFHPDLIQIFGLENPLKTIVGNTKIPIILHLQGILGPIANSYWPSGFNETSLRWPPSKSESLIKNGFIFGQKNLEVRAQKEEHILKNLSFVMGRTFWDNRLSQMINPNLRYFHVDEILRPVFYDNSGKWSFPDNDKCIIMSTLSDTMYKGLDVIMKTCILLKKYARFDFEWNIAGVNSTSKTTKFFEKSFGVSHKELNMNFLGIQNAEQICKTLIISNAYVHPSYIDNSPNSVCEAQIVGVPVIVNYVGGTPSLVVDGETGITVAVNDPYDIASRLILLFENPKLANKISECAVKSALIRHDKDIIFNNLMECYYSIYKGAKK